MDIFQTFGVNIYLLAAEIINFLLVLYVLKRFLYKPIFSMLKKREDAIKKGLDAAEESEKRLEKAKKEEAEIIKSAHEKAQQIIDDAKNESFTILHEAREQAKKQSQIMLDNAREQVEQERKSAEKKVFAKINRVMKEFLQKSTDDLFDEKMQESLVKNAINKFEKEYKSL